jgi:signal transduction histidine kinase
VPALKFVRTSAFRVGVVYLAIFVASVGGLLGFIYWQTAGLIERQTVATIDAEIKGLAEQYNRQGLGGLIQVVALRSAVDRAGSSLYLVTDPERERLTGNLANWPKTPIGPDGWVSFSIEPPGEGRHAPKRALAVTFVLAGGHHLLVGRILDEQIAFRLRLIEALWWSLALTVLLGLIGGTIISQNLSHRLLAITETSGEIMAGNLSRRVPVSKAGDEIDLIATRFNEVLDEVERLMAGMRQVTDNIAHDLRTPLNRLRSRIEVTLMEGDDPQRYKQALLATVAEAEGLLNTFNALLDIAKAEAGPTTADMAPVDLAEISESACELYQPLAEDKGVTFTLRRAAAPIVVGNRHLLSQALVNLLDNAVKYTPAGGTIDVSVDVARTGNAERPRIVVADSGPGIPPQDRERVLERFVRLESSRSTPGNGLGLSLVKAVARQHDATLSLDDNAPGLKVTLTFPPAPAFRTTGS